MPVSSLVFPKPSAQDSSIIPRLRDFQLHFVEIRPSLQLKGRRTRSEFSKIDRQHPNLRLREGALSPFGKSGTPVPIVLSQLVSLRLYGIQAVITGFILSACPPLFTTTTHSAFTIFQAVQVIPAPSKKRLQCTTNVRDWFTRVRSTFHFIRACGSSLILDAGCSTPVPHPTSSLKLRFHGIGN